MSKSIFQLINEQLSGAPISREEVVIDERSSNQLFHEAATEMNNIVSGLMLETANYNEKAVELVILRETTEFQKLNEGFFGNVVEKVKKFFASVIEFLKKLGARVKFEIAALLKNGEQLVATYGEKVRNKTFDKVEINGFKYADFSKFATDGRAIESDATEIVNTFNDADNKIGGLYDAAKKGKEENSTGVNKTKSEAKKGFDEMFKKLKDSSSDVNKAARASMVVSLTSTSPIKNGSYAEISAQLLKIGRGGKTEKTVIKLKELSMSEICNNLEKAPEFSDVISKVDTFKGEIETHEKTVTEKLEAVLKEIEKTNPEAGDNHKQGRAEFVAECLREYSTIAIANLQQVYGAVNTCNQAFITLSKEKYNQDKAAFIAAYRSLGKKANKDSSEELDEEDFMDLELI